MSTLVKAMSITNPGLQFSPFEFTLPNLPEDQIECKVLYCGVCHSDISMAKNDWGMTQYPFVPGHEIVGEITALGKQVTDFKVGQKIGIGWYSKSCMTCEQCLSGQQHLCPKQEGTIVGRHGGFATHVRTHWSWATPLPANLNIEKAGPLFCGGITVFGPIHHFGIKPTDKVGVIGIGGLGHLAIQFLNKWGCEVTAFTSEPSKADWVKKLGAHQVVSSTKAEEIQKLAGKFNFILNTANVTLPWDAYIQALAPNGRLHFVGAVLEPVPTHPFALITGQKSISGSPLGSPATLRKMLEFCERHKIETITETFPLSKATEAIAHVESGKARFRVVLVNDL